MATEIVSGKNFQRTIVTEALAVASDLPRAPRCRLISVAGPDPMLAVNRAVHVRTLQTYGLECEDVHLPAETDLAGIEEVISVANQDSGVDGVMVLLPLPEHLSLADILPLIKPEKELEGLHPGNAGAVLGHVNRMPESPDVLVTEALHAQLEDIGFDLSNAHVVILSEASLLGENVLANLVQRAAGPASLPLTTTVSLVVTENPRAREIARQADLLVVSLENPGVVGADYVKPGSVVIDFNPTLIGMTEVEGEPRPILKGGVRPEEMDTTSYYSPAPGGVGPVMLGILMRNLIRAAARGPRQKADEMPE